MTIFRTCRPSDRMWKKMGNYAALSVKLCDFYLRIFNIVLTGLRSGKSLSCCSADNKSIKEH